MGNFIAPPWQEKNYTIQYGNQCKAINLMIIEKIYWETVIYVNAYDQSIA